MSSREQSIGRALCWPRVPLYQGADSRLVSLGCRKPRSSAPLARIRALPVAHRECSAQGDQGPVGRLNLVAGRRIQDLATAAGNHYENQLVN